jgi:hypothetical protein
MSKANTRSASVTDEELNSLKQGTYMLLYYLCLQTLYSLYLVRHK